MEVLANLEFLSSSLGFSLFVLVCYLLARTPSHKVTDEKERLIEKRMRWFFVGMWALMMLAFVYGFSG